jgi:predicted RNA binding protein with dsRBD fold (UPF0201 family)
MRTPPPSTDAPPPGQTESTHKGKRIRECRNYTDLHIWIKFTRTKQQTTNKNREAILKARREYLDTHRDIINKRARDHRAKVKAAKQAAAAAEAAMIS